MPDVVLFPPPPPGLGPLEEQICYCPVRLPGAQVVHADKAVAFPASAVLVACIVGHNW